MTSTERPSNSGVKHDAEKNRLELIDPEFLDEFGLVMTFGARKYSPDNWRGGFEYRRLIGAVLRHTMSWAKGEDADPETGLSHLAHAACELMFLFWMNKHRKGTDDRLKTEKENDDG